MPEEPPSYHDVHITTKDLDRVALFNLPYGFELTCNRVGGWTLWNNNAQDQIASEFGEGLRVDVAGHVICDSLTKRE